mgnify:CR=1 FL=1
MPSRPFAITIFLLCFLQNAWPVPALAQIDRLRIAAGYDAVSEAALYSQTKTSVDGADSADANGSNAQSNAERIVTLRDQYTEMLDTIHGNSVVYYDNPEAVREGLNTIEAAEAAAAEIRPVMRVVAERYGRERGSITEAMDAAGEARTRYLHPSTNPITWLPPTPTTCSNSSSNSPTRERPAHRPSSMVSVPVWAIWTTSPPTSSNSAWPKRWK